MLFLPGFGDLQPYEPPLEILNLPWECFWSVSGLAPDLVPEMLNRARGTFKIMFWNSQTRCSKGGRTQKVSARNTQMSTNNCAMCAKESKRKSAQERTRAQKGTKGPFHEKNCKQPAPYVHQRVGRFSAEFWKIAQVVGQQKNRTCT